MQATERLFLTADRKSLVSEGHVDAAFLYAAPGDEIPEAAVQQFALVDGGLAKAVEALLRVASISGATIGVALFTFGPDWLEFGAGDLDEAMLLAILKEPALTVQGAIEGESEKWIEFPDRDHAIEILQAHVDWDLERGRPHDLIERRGIRAEPHPADLAKAEAEEAANQEQIAAAAKAAEKTAADETAGPAAGASETAAPTTPAETQEPAVKNESAPAPAKESKAAATKEAKPAATKEAKAGADKAKGE